MADQRRPTLAEAAGMAAPAPSPPPPATADAIPAPSAPAPAPATALRRPSLAEAAAAYKGAAPSSPTWAEGGPMTVAEQTALSPDLPGVEPVRLRDSETALYESLLEQNRLTNTPEPEKQAMATLFSYRKQVAPSDTTDLVSPLGLSGAALAVESASEPGALPYRAANAFAPQRFGSPEPGMPHGLPEPAWAIAETPHDREVGKVIRYLAMVDSGVPEPEAKLRAQAAFETGEPLLVPTRYNVTHTAAPLVDVVDQPVELRNTYTSAATDVGVGLVEGARDLANIAKDAAVDPWLYVGEHSPLNAVYKNDWWAGKLKDAREWTFPSPTAAVADWLDESSPEAARLIRDARERGGGSVQTALMGGMELNNALNATASRVAGTDVDLWVPFVPGMIPMDPNDDGFFNAIANVALSKGLHQEPIPVPSAEEAVGHMGEAGNRYKDAVTRFYGENLSGVHSPDTAMQAGTAALDLFTTPVMDVMMMSARTPDVEERESALSWFFRVVPTASFALVSGWLARAADYAARSQGATSFRRNRNPLDEDPGFWESVLPVFVYPTDNSLHDYLTSVRNGDTFTPEYMRFADTMAYGMPGLSDENRARWMPGGGYRELGTRLAMVADLFGKFDRAPHKAWGAIADAGRFHEVYTTSRKAMQGTGDAARPGQLAAASVAPSLTHRYLMARDPEYAAAFKAMGDTAADKAVETAAAASGQTTPARVPDVDAVRNAVALAWARDAVRRGFNPAVLDPTAPRLARDLVNTFNEYLTTLRIVEDEPRGVAPDGGTAPDGAAPAPDGGAGPSVPLGTYVHDPATTQALMGLGHTPEQVRRLPPEEAARRIREQVHPEDYAPPEPTAPDAVPSVVADADALWTVASKEKRPPLGSWSPDVLAEADPVKRAALMLAEVDEHLGAPDGSVVSGRALQAALSFVDPKTGRFIRAPFPTPDVLLRYVPADVMFALNRLRDATPEQVWRNVGDFERGKMPRWVDETPQTRAKAEQRLRAMATDKRTGFTPADVDAFLTVQDRVAQRLVDLGVVKTPDEWFAQVRYEAEPVRGGRGSTTFADVGPAIIKLARDADLSTLFHESGHVLRRLLPKERMAALDVYVRETFGGWTVKAEEWFATQLESVLRTGDLVPASVVDAPRWHIRIRDALRYAADVLGRLYKDGALPDVSPVFKAWVTDFLALDIQPAKATAPGLAVEPPVKPAPPPMRRAEPTVRVADTPAPPAAAPPASGWSPKMLADFTASADAVKRLPEAERPKAVQAWLSELHRHLGEDKATRAKRHRLAGGIGIGILDKVLAAGRDLVAQIPAGERAAADAAYNARLALPPEPEPVKAPRAKPPPKEPAAPGGVVMVGARPGKPPPLPEVLRPTPKPAPIPLPPEEALKVARRPLPGSGTADLTQYGHRRTVLTDAGPVESSVVTLDLDALPDAPAPASLVATFDPVLGAFPFGVDPSVGSPVVLVGPDGPPVAVQGRKRLAALRDLYRRAKAGEEPYATRWAAVRGMMESAAVAAGLPIPRPSEVLVRSVGKGAERVAAMTGATPALGADSLAWFSLEPALTQAAWAGRPSTLDQVARYGGVRSRLGVDPVLVDRVVADAVGLVNLVDAGTFKDIDAAAAGMRDHYIPIANARTLAVSEMSVAVAKAIRDGKLLDAVQAPETLALVPDHAAAVAHARDLEMAAIDVSVKNAPIPEEPPGFGPVKDLLQHRIHTDPIAARDPVTGQPLPVPDVDVFTGEGRDMPARFTAENPATDVLVTPAGQKLARARAIPLSTREQILLDMGYRPDQTVFPARELSERLLAHIITRRLQASEARSTYVPISDRVAVPKQRAAAVRARVALILGDLPEVLKRAGERRTDLGPGVLDESPPLRLNEAEAARVRAILDYLDYTGWIDSLNRKPVAGWDVAEIQARLTTADYADIASAVADSVSGAAPYRGQISQFSLARNLVWSLAQRPEGAFTPRPLEATAGIMERLVNQARGVIGAAILNTANFALPWDNVASVRPDVRPVLDRASREIHGSATQLAEAVTEAVEAAGGATPGRMQQALQSVAAAAKGWRPLVDVAPRNRGPSDLTSLRSWLYNGDPASYGVTATLDPHDLPRTMADPRGRFPARPINDPVAEVYAHADLVTRVLLSQGRSVDRLSIRIREEILTRTLTPETAEIVIGQMYAILNECADIGVEALTAAAGHSGEANAIAKRVRSGGDWGGLALDAYEALFQFRWSDDPYTGIGPANAPGAPVTARRLASIEGMVRALAASAGSDTARLRTDLWAFDVINRLNAREIKARVVDELIDLDYAQDLTGMAEAAGMTFGSLAEEARFSAEVRRAINQEMWGTNYIRSVRLDANGEPIPNASGNVEVGIQAASVSPEAMAAARVIIAKTGVRPDVLTVRRGFKGEMGEAVTTAAFARLDPDPVKRAEQVATPGFWQTSAELHTSRGRDVYMPDAFAEALNQALKRASPLSDRLAAILSQRQGFERFFQSVNEYYRQLKGALISGGPNSWLATAVLVGAVWQGAPILAAAELSVAAYALSMVPRVGAFSTNAIGALVQGAMEMGARRAATAVGRKGWGALRATQETVQFRRMGILSDLAGRAAQAVQKPTDALVRPLEATMFTTKSGRVYSLADVVRMGRQYGLDGTQARVESAARSQITLDALHRRFDRDPTIRGTMWNAVSRFYDRTVLAENYRRFYESIDTWFRYIWLLDGLDEGLTPAEAVARSLRTSFDYTATSTLDSWANAIFMFWMYQRRAVDLTLAALAEHPETVLGPMRFMRAQDLTSGYSDLDEDYTRQSETVPEYGIGRVALDYWPVAGSRNAAVKQMLPEFAMSSAARLINDVLTIDIMGGVMGRAAPQYQVAYNILNDSVGGSYIDFFRKTAKDDTDDAAAYPMMFAVLDQQLTGGAFGRGFNVQMRAQSDPFQQAAPGVGYTFAVPSNRRIAWDLFRQGVPGASTVMTLMDQQDRANGPLDAFAQEFVKLLGAPENWKPVTPESVAHPAVDQQPRPQMGQNAEENRFYGMAPATLATPGAAQQRPADAARAAVEERLRIVRAELDRMRPPVKVPGILAPEQVKPEQDLGVDPEAPIGVVTSPPSSR